MVTMFYFGSSALIHLLAASGYPFTNCSLFPTARKGGVFKACQRPLGRISTATQPRPPMPTCTSCLLHPLSGVPASLVGHSSEQLWKAWNEKETIGHIPAASTQRGEGALVCVSLCHPGCWPSLRALHQACYP